MSKKVFAINIEVPRIGDRAQIVAGWYLRFNGYFLVENFILQDGGFRRQPGGQFTDADILAVRFPHTKEIIKGKNQDIEVQPHRDLRVNNDVTDFIIAEVSSTSCKFNWINPDSTEQTVDPDFLQYALRRIGYWKQDRLFQVCTAVSQRKSFEDDNRCERVRLLSIGVNCDKALTDIPQIEFKDIFEYLGGNLFSSFDTMEEDRVIKKVISDHKQWDPLICEIYNRLRGNKGRKYDPLEVVKYLFPDSVKDQAT